MSSRCLRFSKSRPSKMIAPDVGSMRRRMSRPSVLFPEPDSPIKPRVSPAAISRETSSTARTSAADPAPDPPLKGEAADLKTLVRLRTSTSGTIAMLAVSHSGLRDDDEGPLSGRDQGNRRQRGEKADKFSAAEVLFQHHPRQQHGDSRIKRRDN